MSFTRWLSSMQRRFRSQNRSPRRRRDLVLLGGVRDWLLEDRCLLSGTAFPTITPNANPTAANINTVDSLYGSTTNKAISSVFAAGANLSSTNYNNETVTITNNSTQTIYPFFLDANNKTATGKPPGTYSYAATSMYDPYDPLNQDYRGYIGYQMGSGSTATYYAGLAPSAQITVTVPLAFWNAGTLDFTTDGQDLFSTYSGSAGQGAPGGGPFNFLTTETQATYTCTTDPNDKSNKTLDFVPAYNTFVNSQPSTANYQAPVYNATTNPNGFLETGLTYNVSGPNDFKTTATVSSNSSAPGGYVIKLNAPYSGSLGDFTFTAPSSAAANTARYLETGLSLTTSGSTSKTGVVMWYHSQVAINPNNDAPFQLTEYTIRSAYYGSIPGYQTLMNSIDYQDAKGTAFGYDVSYVDSMNLPVAMEATNVTIGTTGSTAAFGWSGSDQTLAAFASALVNFTTNNNNGNGKNLYLGTYFGGNGYPSYLNLSQGSLGYLKLPAGQNVFLASPFAEGGVSAISYNSNGVNGPQNALTSGPPGPKQFSDGGTGNDSDSNGNNLALNIASATNKYIVQTLIPALLAKGVTLSLSYIPAGKAPVPYATVTGLYYQGNNPKNPVIGVTLSKPIPPNPGANGYQFNLSQTDYAATDIASLWYSWAQYYTQIAKSTTQSLTGNVNGNVLTLTQNPTGNGLVQGMTVSGGGLPAGCVILGISGKTITLSAVGPTTTGGNTKYTFTAPTFSAIAGSTNNGLTLVTSTLASTKGFGPSPATNSTPYLFAQTVYSAMAAWSVSVGKAGTVNNPPWIQLLTNIIGGNLDSSYIPNQNSNVVSTLTNMAIALERGVPFTTTTSTYTNPSLWYPDPSIPTGGLTYNAYNLNPYVWFVHAKLGISAYAFANDDEYGFVSGTGATSLAVSVGGLTGLPNSLPYSPTEPFGVVVTTGSSASGGKVIGTLTNPTTPSVSPKLSTGAVANMIFPPDPSKNRLGSLINGPGVQTGMYVLSTQLNQPADTAKNTVTLSKNLSPNPPANSTYSFFGPTPFTGIPTGNGSSVITLTSPVVNGNTLAYTTLSLMAGGSSTTPNPTLLGQIQVVGEGIASATTYTIKSMTQNVAQGTTTITLSAALTTLPNNLPANTFFAYTFGEAKATTSSPPPVTSPAPLPPTSSPPPPPSTTISPPPAISTVPAGPPTVQEFAQLAVDEIHVTLDSVALLIDRILGLAPSPNIESSLAEHLNDINANPAAQSLLGQELMQFIQMEVVEILETVP